MDGIDRRTLLQRAGALALAAVALPELPASAARGDPLLRRLDRQLDGVVVTPADAAYAKGKLLYDTRFDTIRPRGIVYCASTEDVQRTAAFARRHHVRLTPRCGGHSYAGYSTLAGGLVVDVTRMKRVRLSADAKTASVGAGALLIDVYAALAARGVTVPAGSCPSVGIAGLTLGGGFGYSSRKLGLTCDSLRGLTVVDARGRALACDAGHHSDLFWASRGGGGGSFGIATSFRFRTHAVGDVSVFTIQWPWSDAAAVLAFWQGWAPHAPDGLFANLFLAATTNKGASATPAITSGGQYFGSESDLVSLLAPLVATGSPTRMTVQKLSFIDAVKRFAGCSGTVGQCHRADKSPNGTLPRLTFKGKSDYVNRPLSAQGIQTLLARLEVRQADPLLGRGEYVLDAYGGAVNRVPKRATAFVHRDALFSIQYVALWRPGDCRQVVRRNLSWIEATYAAMRPYVSGFAYQNYIDPALRSWRHAYYGSNFRRLVRVKRRYDPGNVFRFPQSIPTRL